MRMLSCKIVHVSGNNSEQQYNRQKLADSSCASDRGGIRAHVMQSSYVWLRAMIQETKAADKGGGYKKYTTT